MRAVLTSPHVSTAPPALQCLGFRTVPPWPRRSRLPPPALRVNFRRWDSVCPRPLFPQERKSSVGKATAELCQQRTRTPRFDLGIAHYEQLLCLLDLGKLSRRRTPISAGSIAGPPARAIRKVKSQSGAQSPRPDRAAGSRHRLCEPRSAASSRKYAPAKRATACLPSAAPRSRDRRSR